MRSSPLFQIPVQNPNPLPGTPRQRLSHSAPSPVFGSPTLSPTRQRVESASVIDDDQIGWTPSQQTFHRLAAYTTHKKGSRVLKLTMSRLLTRISPRRIIPRTLPVRSTRSYASTSPISQFDWEDPLGSKNLLTEEELAVSETAERYCQEQLLPRVLRMIPCEQQPTPLTSL